jgi:hypothetical protein
MSQVVFDARNDHVRSDRCWHTPFEVQSRRDLVDAIEHPPPSFCLLPGEFISQRGQVNARGRLA